MVQSSSVDIFGSEALLLISEQPFSFLISFFFFNHFIFFRLFAML